jgi:hypothetical protein
MKTTCLAWHPRIPPLSYGDVATFSFYFLLDPSGIRRGRTGLTAPVANFLKKELKNKKVEGCRCCLAPIPPTSYFLKRSMLGYALTRSLAHSIRNLTHTHTHTHSHTHSHTHTHTHTHSVARLFIVYDIMDLRLVY